MAFYFTKLLRENFRHGRMPCCLFTSCPFHADKTPLHIRRTSHGKHDRYPKLGL